MWGEREPRLRPAERHEPLRDLGRVAVGRNAVRPHALVHGAVQERIVDDARNITGQSINVDGGRSPIW